MARLTKRMIDNKGIVQIFRFIPALVVTLISALPLLAQPYLLNIPIRAVAQDTAQPIPITWVATEGGIFRSSATGPEWRSVFVRPAGLTQPIVRFIHIERDRPQVVYLVSNLDSGGIWKTADGGATWAQANQGLPPTGSIDAFIHLPSAPSTFYVRVSEQIFKSTDSAATWKAQGGALPRNAVAWEVNRNNPAQMFAAAANGIYRSRDEGLNWTLSQVLNLNSSAEISSILVDPSDATIVHLVARGAKDSGAGFYRSVDGGDRFDVVVLPVDRTFILPARLVSDPTGRAVYAGADENGVVYFTTNKGAIWGQLIVSGAGLTSVAVDPNDPKVLFAATTRGLFASTNSGARWESRAGSATPTLSVPTQPLEFVLPAGARGNLQFLLRVVESTQWTLPLSASVQGGAWLTLQGDAISTPATPSVVVDTRNLERGEYTGEVRVDAPLSSNAPLRVPVKLIVTAPRLLSRSYRIATMAGNGQRGNFGDNLLATRASFADLDSVVVDRDGNIYVSDPASNIVRRIGPDGVISRYAGSARRGDSGDGGQALLAQLSSPTGLALDAAGNLFIADTGNEKIRRVSRDGTFTTLASGVGPCRGLAVDSAGNVYAAVPAAHVLLRVTQAGAVTLYAGVVGGSGFRGDGGPVARALFSGPLDLFVDNRDRLYVADTGNQRIRRVEAGVITTVAGSGGYGFQGDGVDATKVALAGPAAVAADTSGNFFIADAENHRIRMVTADGAIRTLVGTGVRGFTGDNGPALLAQIIGPQDIAVEFNGDVLSVEPGNVRIRRLVPPPPPVEPVITEGPLNWADGSGRLAPGTVFRIIGSELSSQTVTQAEAPWPLDLGGVQVTLNGLPLPLSKVSATEIVGLIPFSASVGTVPLRVIREEAPSSEAIVTLAPTAPALLLAGEGRALAANQTGAANAAEEPAAGESLLTLFFTGVGLTENPPVDGAGAAEESRPLLPVLVHFGDLTVEPVQTRLSPGRVGIAEVQIRIPVNEAGDYPVAVRVGDSVSATALISVKKTE